MPRPLAIVGVALAVGIASVLPLQRGQDARAALGSATGPLVVTDVAGAVLTAQDLKPGDARTAEITVRNAGDTGGSFALTEDERVDSPTGAGPLSGVLDLTIEDLTAGRIVFAGKLGALDTVALGDFAESEAHRFRFTVSFPGGRSAALDDPYQGASASVRFVWSATAPEPAGTTPAAPHPVTEENSSAPSAASSVPTARVSGPRTQRMRRGAAQATVSCDARCKVTVTGTAGVGRARFKLRAVKVTLAPGSHRVRIVLPRKARSALVHHKSVTLRLRVRAVMGTRVVTVRTTLRVLPAAS
jgi:spore coat-associated protein N